MAYRFMHWRAYRFLALSSSIESNKLKTNAHSTVSKRRKIVLHSYLENYDTLGKIPVGHLASLSHSHSHSHTLYTLAHTRLVDRSWRRRRSRGHLAVKYKSWQKKNNTESQAKTEMFSIRSTSTSMGYWKVNLNLQPQPPLHAKVKGKTLYGEGGILVIKIFYTIFKGFFSIYYT